jgi:hypothetical protein
MRVSPRAPCPQRLLAVAALLSSLTAACGSAPAARTAAWPDGLESDFFRTDLVASSGTSHLDWAAKPLPQVPSENGWSLAAADWGSADQGGFPAPEGLTQDELRRIEEGWTVARPFEFEGHRHAYVGGVAFQIVEASSEEVLSALLDVEQLPHALPLTHRARLVEKSETDQLVEIVQGNSLMKARYAVRLTRVGDHAIRFTMDPRHPHDIRDARGYFTATRFSERHTLVTVAVGIDLGQGLARSMLKRQVQKVALSAPAHLRRYVEPRAAAAADVVALR